MSRAPDAFRDPEYVAMLRQDPCAYCGKRGGSIDHLTPKVNGGTDEWDNLTSACGRCNWRKNVRGVLEILMDLQIRPNPPQWREMRHLVSTPETSPDPAPAPE